MLLERFFVTASAVVIPVSATVSMLFPFITLHPKPTV